MQVETATGPAAVPPAPTFSRLATVEKTADLYADAGLTPAAIRALVFRADDRSNNCADVAAVRACWHRLNWETSASAEAAA